MIDIYCSWSLGVRVPGTNLSLSARLFFFSKFERIYSEIAPCLQVVNAKA